MLKGVRPLYRRCFDVRDDAFSDVRAKPPALACRCGRLERGLGRTARVGPHREPALEPVVSDTSTVSRQVFEPVQPIEVVDRYLCHGLWYGETQIDGDAPTPL
jgi:hypothetical protein